MLRNGELDEIDKKILALLQDNARLDVSRIADKVCKSHTSTLDRVHKLEDLRIIKKYNTILDRRLVGWPTLMITLVKLRNHAAQTLIDFPIHMNRLPEVQVCLHLSGEFDFMLQIILKDPFQYGEFLNNKLCCLDMVDKVQSSLVLKECKMQTTIPIL